MTVRTILREPLARTPPVRLECDQAGRRFHEGLTSGVTVGVSDTLQLQLLQRFEVRRGGCRVALPDSAQRLVAFLALREGPHRRSTIAGTLWMDMPEEQSGANLRTTLWRVNRVANGLIDSSTGYLAISPSVTIDLHTLVRSAKTLIDCPETDVVELDATARQLGDDLLPEWYDDWVLLERERLRQFRLHGLEALCSRLSRLGRHLAAIDAGLLAVEADPLRESAQRALIAAHLAEGNVSEAVRQYDLYAALLDDAIAAKPSDALKGLVADWR
jgi:DNA-binding SARP family transcriptional activator